MKMLLWRVLFVAVLLIVPFGAVPAVYAQDHDDEAEEHADEGQVTEDHGGIDFVGGPDWGSVQDVTIWSIAGVSIFATALGVLYLFKRKVGGFPEHPTWVAPISIMPAGELPSDDESEHGAAGGQESHGAHGSHAAAH